MLRRRRTESANQVIEFVMTRTKSRAISMAEGPRYWGPLTTMPASHHFLNLHWVSCVHAIALLLEGIIGIQDASLMLRCRRESGENEERYGERHN